MHTSRSPPVQRSLSTSAAAARWQSLCRSFPCPLIVTVLSRFSYRKVICGQLLLILEKQANKSRVCFCLWLQKLIVNNGVKLVNALETRVRESERERWWRNNWNKLSVAPTQDNHIKNRRVEEFDKETSDATRRWRGSSIRWITFHIFFGGNGRSRP